MANFGNFRGRLGDADAALVAGRRFLELALAAAAGVDLALHDPDRARECLCRRVRIGCLQDRNALRDRDTELVQQRFGLIFMDIHLVAP
ncbi:hypothetical protein ACVWZ6_000699 [Bradyrhizobium sp. GM6.1]